MSNIIKWKGKTFNELSLIIKKNSNTNESLPNTLLPNPVILPRSELPVDSCTNYIIKEVEYTDYTTPSVAIKRIRSAGMNTEKTKFIDNTKLARPYYSSTPQYINGTIHKDCNIIKLNNPQFSQQGGVSYSNYVLRKHFDTIETSNILTGDTFTVPYIYAETIKYAHGDAKYSPFCQRGSCFHTKV